jgi:tyrosyl-DNA phosphodiesterase-1
MNYVVDLEQLYSACPSLHTVPVILAHGMDVQMPSGGHMVASRVNVTIPFGTHHTKMCIIFYDTGVRVAIMTANLLKGDFFSKTQGVWVQDFPHKSTAHTPKTIFERDLIEYLQSVQLTDQSVARQMRDTVERLSDFDFSSAEVVLIGSVPGRHEIHSDRPPKWGHLKLKGALRDEGRRKTHKPENLSYTSDWFVAMQFSSLASLRKDETYLDEVANSMMMRVPTSRKVTDAVRLYWPSVDCIRLSYEGYQAGGAVCGYKKVKNLSETSSKRCHSTVLSSHSLILLSC